MVVHIGTRWHVIVAGWRDETDVVMYRTACGRTRASVFSDIKHGTRRATCKTCRKRWP